jgi:hypothetical protein
VGACGNGRTTTSATGAEDASGNELVVAVEEDVVAPCELRRTTTETEKLSCEPSPASRILAHVS